MGSSPRNSPSALLSGPRRLRRSPGFPRRPQALASAGRGRFARASRARTSRAQVADARCRSGGKRRSRARNPSQVASGGLRVADLAVVAALRPRGLIGHCAGRWTQATARRARRPEPSKTRDWGSRAASSKTSDEGFRAEPTKCAQAPPPSARAGPRREPPDVARSRRTSGGSTAASREALPRDARASVVTFSNALGAQEANARWRGSLTTWSLPPPAR